MPNKSPIVSVVVPTFNEQSNLQVCLQQFNGIGKGIIELVVSDDGSSDGTLKIAHKLADVVVERPKHIELHTIARNRNAGARAASGLVIVFIDADTIVRDPAGFIEIVSEQFAQQSNLASLVPRVEIEPKQAKLSDRLVHGYINFQYRVLVGLGMAGGGGQCQIVRRDAFNSVGGYHEALTASEDIELIRRLKKIGKVKFSPSLVVYESPRRYRDQGYVRTLWQWFVNYISVLFKGRAHSKHWKRVR